MFMVPSNKAKVSIIWLSPPDTMDYTARVPVGLTTVYFVKMPPGQIRTLSDVFVYICHMYVCWCLSLCLLLIDVFI